MLAALQQFAVQERRFLKFAKILAKRNHGPVGDRESNRSVSENQ
jgi:hypothetical protein